MKKAVYWALAAILVVGGMTAVNGCAGGKERLGATDADMTGRWNMSVTTPHGAGTPSFDLMQEGDQLSGTYTGRFGEFPVTGSVKGNQFEIRYDSSGVLIKYIGESDGATAEGKVDFGSFGSGTFTGKKE